MTMAVTMLACAQIVIFILRADVLAPTPANRAGTLQPTVHLQDYSKPARRFLISCSLSRAGSRGTELAILRASTAHAQRQDLSLD